jgi:alpha/beta superfamily hydrolase
MVADVRAQVMLSLFTDFENFSTFNPAEHHERAVEAMLDQVVQWSAALKPLRKDDPPVPVPDNMPPRGPRVGGSF